MKCVLLLFGKHLVWPIVYLSTFSNETGNFRVWAPARCSVIFGISFATCINNRTKYICTLCDASHSSWIFYLRWCALYSFIVYIIFVIGRLYGTIYNTHTSYAVLRFWFVTCYNGNVIMVFYMSDESNCLTIWQAYQQPYKCINTQRIVLHVISCNNKNHCHTFNSNSEYVNWITMTRQRLNIGSFLFSWITRFLRK